MCVLDLVDQVVATQRSDGPVPLGALRLVGSARYGASRPTPKVVKSIRSVAVASPVS